MEVRLIGVFCRVRCGMNYWTGFEMTVVATVVAVNGWLTAVAVRVLGLVRSGGCAAARWF